MGTMAFSRTASFGMLRRVMKTIDPSQLTQLNYRRAARSLMLFSRSR